MMKTTPPASVPTTSQPEAPTATDGESSQPDRPFGAHLRMPWWAPILLTIGLLGLMLILQLVTVTAVAIGEIMLLGRDPDSTTLSPLMLLAVNLSLALTGVIAAVLTRIVAKIPLRTLLAAPRRPSAGRLGTYLTVFTLLVLAALGISELLAPQPQSISGVALTGTTIGLLAVALLTTPLQAAGEELLFRGTIMPAISSWVRPVGPALVLGVAVSTVLFGISHASIDPWLLTYYTVFGLSMAVMAIISKGLEAPIAFHVANNVVMMAIGSVFNDGAELTLDRSVGMGGPFMLIFIALDLLAVGVVWLIERRRNVSSLNAE